MIENVLGQQQGTLSQCVTGIADLRTPSSDNVLPLGLKENKDIKDENYLVSKSGQGSIKSMESLDDKKIDSPSRPSGSERGRGFEPEGKMFIYIVYSEN